MFFELLDLCNNMQEISVELKAIIQELQVALRKGEDTTVQAKIQSYIRLVKKAGKQFKKTTRKATSTRWIMECRFAKIQSYTRLAKKAKKYFKKTCNKASSARQSVEWSGISQEKGGYFEEEQLQELECSMGDLESEAGHLFRKLVQNRVSPEHS
ncbi:hypothetical protein ZWY2020_025845 [Hordeum vulgare]|nr:hypothetical protein ZWY2020_025845 [Hordeum vulgare]